MSSQASFGTSMLFQTMNDDLNASLATADELSKEFSSLMESASTGNSSQLTETVSVVPREKLQPLSPPFSPSNSSTTRGQGSSSSGSSSSLPYSPSSPSPRPHDVIISNTKNRPSSPVFTSHQLTPPPIRSGRLSPVPRSGTDSYQYRSVSPNRSPRLQRNVSPSRSNRSPRGSVSYRDSSPSPSPSAFDQSPRPNPLMAPNLLSPYDGPQMGRRSPQPRVPSPGPFNNQMASTLPRNFGSFSQPDESLQRKKSPNKWNETDLDVSYEKKPHHTYNNTEWLRLPNSSWMESNLDGPLPPPNSKKDSISHAQHASLPRNTRISIPPDSPSPAHSPYHTQPIISRISIPPASPQPRQHRPIPLSVIMRLQNPQWALASHTKHPRTMHEESNMCLYPPQPMSLPREFFTQPMHRLQAPPPELTQPAFYGEVLNPGDIDAELERLDLVHTIPVIHEPPGAQERDSEPPAMRPRSPTRLQPMVAAPPESQEVPNLEEVLRIRAEIPRALKRRGSVDQSLPLKSAAHYEPNQYKHLINKLFRKKSNKQKGSQEGELSSSSEDDMMSEPASPVNPPPASATGLHSNKGYHSILRRTSKEHKNSTRRARLSPLVLLLDGALVGEVETVKRALQEMSDASQPNDEGITALHNAVCGGHYAIVDCLVRVGANVSAPDSHGWTPLHCAASCNDRPLCEFLVRNGAAIMAVTESDGAISSQKCDPYAPGYEECESFLRGVEEATGVENGGVLYALWSYPAQGSDELSFREGDMVTILQRPEGLDWWWASLCGREGFVPNNYFGLFPKVRPKSLC